MLARALADYDELDGLNVPVPGGYQVHLLCSPAHHRSNIFSPEFLADLMGMR